MTKRFKPPCAECLKFPICRFKGEIECRDLYNHLHTFWNRYQTIVYLNGKKLNSEAAFDVMNLFNKKIHDINRIRCAITLRKKGVTNVRN